MHDRKDRLALAQAVIKPNGAAMLITEEGRKRGWVSLPEAVDSGMAYLVDPHPQFLALDLDFDEFPELQDIAYELCQDLRRYGTTYVLSLSGSPGNMHLWIKVGMHTNGIEF